MKNPFSKGKSKKRLLPSLDNTHIDRFFNEVIRDKHYVNCVAKDELYSMKTKRCFMLINSGDSNDRESDNHHWTCMFTLDPNFIIVFDSFGSLMNEGTEYYAKLCARKFKQTIVYNDSEYQVMDTDSCGFFCIYVLLLLLQGNTFDAILNTFNKKTITKNEEYLYKWFNTTELNGKSLLKWLTETI